MPTVEERVASNISLFGDSPYTSDEDRLAARYLFSSLSHLEQIAVIAAERGDCIAGQLEDELVHRKTFEILAEMHGGLVDPAEPVMELIDYLSELEGEDSLAALNVVAESWLDTVFDHLAAAGVATEMLEVIEAEEHRHAHEALEMARPDPEAFTQIVRDLEEMLAKVSATTEFILPMVWLMGQVNVSNMGLAICDAHEKGCVALGVEPDLRDMRVSARSHRLLHRTDPQPVEMNEWERVKMETWDDPAPQYCFADVITPETNPVKLQAKFIYATSKVMKRYPRLRNVVRNKKLYRADSVIIGKRALYDEERVMTLWLANPHKHDWKKVVKMLAKQNRRAKSVDYEPYEGTVTLGKSLKSLYPPHRSACVVTYNGSWGGDYGSGPLSGLEGIPTILTIGAPRQKPVSLDDGSVVSANVVTICVCADHRAIDGRDLGIMVTEIKKEVEKIH